MENLWIRHRLMVGQEAEVVAAVAAVGQAAASLSIYRRPWMRSA